MVIRISHDAFRCQRARTRRRCLPASRRRGTQLRRPDRRCSRDHRADGVRRVPAGPRRDDTGRIPSGYDAWDQASGFAGGDDVVGLRRAEDRAALAHLGAVPQWLDFLDSQYVVEPGESAGPADIAAGIRAAIEELRPATIAFPLGLSHTDHERTHEACFLLLAGIPGASDELGRVRRRPVSGFASRASRRSAGSLRELGYELEPLGFDLGERKAAALDEYPSQLKALAASMRTLSCLRSASSFGAGGACYDRASPSVFELIVQGIDAFGEKVRAVPRCGQHRRPARIGRCATW